MMQFLRRAGAFLLLSATCLCAPIEASAQIIDPKEYARSIREQQRFNNEYLLARKNAKDAEKSYRRWVVLAPLIGFSFYFILFLIGRARQRRSGSSSDEMPTPRAAGGSKASLPSLITSGKQTPQELAMAVFEALRLSSFNDFRLLFPTQAEMKAHMDPEKMTAYQEKVLAEAVLRQIFQKLREKIGAGRMRFQSAEMSDPAPLRLSQRPDAKQLEGIQLATVVIQDPSESRKVTLGSLVHFPQGWKLFLPKIS